MSSDQPPPPDPGSRPPDEPEPPPPGDAVAPPRRLHTLRLPFVRSDLDRYLAGVAGGGGQRLGIDPFFLRIGLVSATLLLARDNSGAFVLPLLAYLGAWLILPTQSDRSLLRRVGQRPAQQEIVGAMAVFVLGVVVIGRPSLVWAGVLLAIAAMMLGNRTPPAVEGPTVSTEVAPLLSTDEKAASWGRSLRGAISPRGNGHTPKPRSPRTHRRSPALWPLTLSLLVAYIVGCVLLDNLMDPGLNPGIAVNGALLIIGGVILLAGWRGRAWLTTLLVLPLIPAWVAFSVVDTPRFADDSSASGAATERFVDGQVLEASRGYGDLVMHLDNDKMPSSGSITAEVTVTAGEAEVWVPKEADIRVVGHIGFGQIEVYDESGRWTPDTLDSLVDYGLNRTYAAVGRACFTSAAPDAELRAIAEWSGVPTPADASEIDVADAIEEAGYPRPSSRSESIHGYAYDQDAETGDFRYDPETGEVVEQITDQTYWSFQTNDIGGLCLPEPPPDDPVLITIDATVGLGKLTVHRV